MNGESKVIPFENLQNRQTVKYNPNSIFALGWSVFIQGITEQLTHFFALLDEELFNLSEQANTNILQSYYFNYMRYFRCHRGMIEERYLLELKRLYESVWHNKPPPQLGVLKTRKENSDLSLLDDELLEEGLALSAIIEKGNNLFRKELYTLDRRFAVLLGKPDQIIEISPVGPMALCCCFSSSLEDLILDIKIKILLYNLMEKGILGRIGPVYYELNTQMARAGAHPPLPKVKLARHQQPEKGLQKPNKAQGLPSKSDINKSPLNRKSRIIIPKESAQILDLLQEASKLMIEKKGILTGEQLRRLLISSQDTPPKSLFSRRSEEVVDLVWIIFVCILEDPLLPASIKALLASLQIPVLKIAIVDQAFTSQKNHPVRMLLNSLTQAGVGLENGQELESPVYQKIKSVTERLSKTSCHDPILAYALLEDFNTFMAIEYRRNRAVEERTRQAIACKDRLANLAFHEQTGAIAPTNDSVGRHERSTQAFNSLPCTHSATNSLITPIVKDPEFASLIQEFEDHSKNKVESETVKTNLALQHAIKFKHPSSDILICVEEELINQVSSLTIGQCFTIQINQQIF